MNAIQEPDIANGKALQANRPQDVVGDRPLTMGIRAGADAVASNDHRLKRWP